MPEVSGFFDYAILHAESITLSCCTMKPSPVQFFFGVLVTSALISTPALAASPAGSHHHGDPRKSGAAGQTHGEITAINASSFILQTSGGAHPKTVTVDFTSGTLFFDTGHVLTITSQSYQTSSHTPMAAFASSKLAVGMELFVGGTKNTDGSIQAMYARTLPSHIMHATVKTAPKPKHSKAK